MFETPAVADDNWTRWKRAQMFLKQKNYKRAEDNFSYFLRNSNMPSNVRMAGFAYYGLGLTYQDMGREDKAVKHYLLAIKNDVHPDVSVKGGAFMNLGAIYMKRKDYKDAIYAYSKAVEHNKNKGLAHYYLGLAYFKNGQYKEAREESVKAEERGVPFTALSEKLEKLGKNKPETTSE